jgi:hypothetical protein
MAVRIDYTGQIVGKCLALRREKYTDNSGQTLWVFQCPYCPGTFTARVTSVRADRPGSCGCIGRPGRRTPPQTYLEFTVHRIWTDMKQRCYNPNCLGYAYYGAKGIVVCDNWKRNFGAFKHYMGPRPSIEHTLHRIDHKGHYEPGNVKWATRQEDYESRTVIRNESGQFTKQKYLK